jgi:hypothetical protein
MEPLANEASRELFISKAFENIFDFMVNQSETLREIIRV